MKNLQLGEFEEIVLLVVGILHGNAYGVTIKDGIEDRTGREVSVGALQVTLRRLETKGYLKSKRGDSTAPRGGRPKLYFEITAFGKKAIEFNWKTRNELWESLPKKILKLR